MVRAGARGGEVPLPRDVKSQTRLLRAVLSLVQEFSPTLAPPARDALFEWLTPVTGERGETKLLEGGLFHIDKIQLVLLWEFRDWEVRNLASSTANKPADTPVMQLLDLPKPMRTWIDAQLAQMLYEGPILCGVLWLDAFLEAAAGQQPQLWTSLLRGKGEVRVPPFAQAVTQARQRLDDLAPRGRYKRAHQKVLQDFLDSLLAAKILARRKPKAPPGKQPRLTPSITYVRDSLAHAKYVYDDNGLFLDPYEHKIVDVREYRGGHPYAYRALAPENAREMLRIACSYVVVFWAAYEEFRIPASGLVTASRVRVDQELVSLARRRLRRLRLTHAETRRRDEAAREARVAARKRVRVTAAGAGGRQP